MDNFEEKILKIYKARRLEIYIVDYFEANDQNIKSELLEEIKKLMNELNL